MATFLNDTMTDTAGVQWNAHTGETGATWTAHPSYAPTNAVITDANRLRANAVSSNYVHYASGTPASADYTVKANIRPATLLAGSEIGVAGRVATAANTMYLARYINDTASWSLDKFVAGVFTNLGTFAQTLTATNTYELQLAMTGTTIALLVDGVSRVSVTDSGVAAAGKAGAYLASGTTAPTNTTGYHLDDVAGATVVDVAIDDAGLYLSPYSWFVSGTTYAQASNGGSYLRLGFTGSTVKLKVDVTPLTGGAVAAGNYPSIAWTVDDAALTTRQLLSTDTTISLTTGLAAGSHTLRVWIEAVSRTPDRWTTPVNVVRVTGLQLAAFATTSAPTLRTRRAVIYGDSIVEGYLAVDGTTSSATMAFALAVLAALDAEGGVIGWPSQGWGRAGDSNVPTFHTVGTATSQTWDKHYAGQTRLAAGLFSPAPDYVVVLHGINDVVGAVSDATVTAAANDWLAAVRTAAPNAYIFLVIPPGGQKKAALTATTRTDGRMVLVDLGTDLAAGLDASATGPATRKAFDGLHPNRAGGLEIATRLAAALQAVLSSGAVARGALVGGARVSQWA
jgi:lysophospholipase L1-like esterase